MYDLLHVGGNRVLAKNIGRKLNKSITWTRTHVFADGEMEIHAEITSSASGPWIVLFGVDRSRINDCLLELFSMLNHLRSQGQRILAVACFYLPYARQDYWLRHGHGPSPLRYILHQLSQYDISHFMFLDVHSQTLHDHLSGRVAYLSMASSWLNYLRHPNGEGSVALERPRGAARSHVAKGHVGANLGDGDGFLVISPDEGSMHRARDLSRLIGCDYVCLHKIRRNGEIVFTNTSCLRNVRYSTIMVVDDIIDRGNTLWELMKILRRNGFGGFGSAGGTVGSVVACVTHGVLSGENLRARLRDRGCDLVLSNSIGPFEGNCVDASNVFVKAIEDLIGGGKINYSS